MSLLQAWWLGLASLEPRSKDVGSLGLANVWGGSWVCVEDSDFRGICKDGAENHVD